MKVTRSGHIYQVLSSSYKLNCFIKFTVVFIFLFAFACRFVCVCVCVGGGGVADARANDLKKKNKEAL